MTERQTLVEAEAATWAALAAPSTDGAHDAAVVFLEATSRVPYRCEVEDHIAIIRAEAKHTYEAQAVKIGAVVEAVLSGLSLSVEDRARGRKIAAGVLRQQAAGPT